jgi:hypothetical protein
LTQKYRIVLICKTEHHHTNDPQETSDKYHRFVVAEVEKRAGK